MTSVGTGVKEIRVRDAAGIFRMIYLATRPEGKIDRFSMDLLVRLAARAGLKPKLNLAA